MSNISEPLPPRPPVPNVNVDIDVIEAALRGKRRGRVKRFFIRVVVLAVIVFVGYWAVQQPFFEPVARKILSLAKRVFYWFIEAIKSIRP